MGPVRRLAPLLALGAGVFLGAGIGLPTAHWVAAVLIAPAAASPSSSGHATASASPSPSSSPAPSPSPSPSPTGGPSPTVAPLVCTALVSGQPPLNALRSPPSGYAAEAALDWVGCGADTVPAATSPFTVGGGWLVAVSFTCPSGTASPGAGPTLTVSAVQGRSATPLAGPPALVDGTGDEGDLIQPDGSQAGPGTYRLMVTAPTACLWHLAVYRG